MKKLANVLFLVLFCACLSGQLIPVQNSGAGVTGTWDILVIPVEFNQWTHNQPINPAYNPYYAPVQISDLEERYNVWAKRYYSLVSRGNVTVNFHVFPQWLNMGNMGTYAGNASAPTALLNNAISTYNSNYASHPGWYSEDYYDKTVVAFAAPCYQDEWTHEWEGTSWSINQFIWAIAYIAGSNGKANCISAYQGVGVITHEMGHSLFNLKDKDASSRIPNYRYQLMGAGAWNGCDALDPTAYQVTDIYKNVVPSPIEPWIRVNLGWERQPLQFAAGSLESRLLLAPVTDTLLVKDQTNYRNLLAIYAGGSYYLLENRQQNLNLNSTPNVDWNMPNSQSWDIALPAEGILVWKITDNWRSTYDRDSSYSSLTQMWSEVIDTNPATTTLPSNYRYRYIDGQDPSIGSRTSAFNDISGYNILGKYDAPITLGQSYAIPGTGTTVTYEQRFIDGSIFVRLSNVNSAINDPAPNLATAELTVAPLSFEVEQPNNTLSTRALSVSNTGEEGSFLDYQIVIRETAGREADRDETVQIGSGTDYWPRPFDTWNSRGRSVSLLTSAELGRTGVITQLGWSVRSARSYSLPIKIYLKTTTATTVGTSSWNIDGATLVYNGSVVFSPTGWLPIDIIDFNYTGNNLLVLTEANYGGSGTASTIQFHCVSNATNLHAWNRDSGAYTVDARRPNIRVSFAPALSLHVLQPNGGEQWKVGESRPIQWESVGDISLVDIELSADGGDNWLLLTEDTPNDGFFSWEVPNIVSENCLVRVKSSLEPTVFDNSDAVFSIQPFVPGFQILSPLAGQRVANGSNLNIFWNTVGTVDEIRLEFSGDNGSTWQQIYQGGNDPQNFDWQIWQACSQNCRLKISSVSDPLITETSSSFEIYQPFTWLTAAAYSGELGANETDNIILTVDSSQMYPDVYHAEILVSSGSEQQIIPFTLIVSDDTVLPIPQNIQVSITGSGIRLDWDGIPGYQYKILASDNPLGGFTEVGASSSSTWTDTAGARRFYHIKTITTSK